MNRTPISPISAKRRAKLAAAGVVHPVSTFGPPKNKAPKLAAGRKAGTGPDRATVDVVLGRDGHSCVVCGAGLSGLRGVDWSVHHRLRRSQGLDNRPANLVSVCGHGTAGCHSNIHAGPAAARRAGWLIKGVQEPVSIPMAHALLGWVLLDNAGGWTRTDRRNDNGSED